MFQTAIKKERKKEMPTKERFISSPCVTLSTDKAFVDPNLEPQLTTRLISVSNMMLRRAMDGKRKRRKDF